MKLVLDKIEDTDIIEAICGRLRYQPMLEDKKGQLTVVNPESDVNFVIRKIYEYVKNEMQAWFGDKLREVARPIEKIEVDAKLANIITTVVNIKP